MLYVRSVCPGCWCLHLLSCISTAPSPSFPSTLCWQTMMLRNMCCPFSPAEGALLTVYRYKAYVIHPPPVLSSLFTSNVICPPWYLGCFPFSLFYDLPYKTSSFLLSIIKLSKERWEQREAAEPGAVCCRLCVTVCRTASYVEELHTLQQQNGRTFLMKTI